MATTTLSGELQQPDISQFVADFSGYYRTNKFEIMANLFYSMFDARHPFSLAERCTLMDGINAPELMETLDTGNMVQKSNSEAFNSKGNIVMTGRKLTPMGWKVDSLINFQKIWKEYVQRYRTQKLGLIPNESNTLPDLEQLFTREILKRVSSDLRQAIFSGAFVSGAGATGHLQFMDGFNTILKAEATAGNVTPLAVSVTSPSDVMTKIKQMFEALSPEYQAANDLVFLVSTDVWSKVTDNASGFNTANPSIIVNSGNREEIARDILNKPLPFAPNARVLHEPNIKTGGVLGTLKSNMVVGFDSFDEGAQFRTQLQDRLIKILMDGMLGVNFRRVKPVLGEVPLVCNTAAVA